MITVNIRPGQAVNPGDRPGPIARLRGMTADPARLAQPSPAQPSPAQPSPAQPGAVAVALHGRQLTPVAECAPPGRRGRAAADGSPRMARVTARQPREPSRSAQATIFARRCSPDSSRDVALWPPGRNT